MLWNERLVNWGNPYSWKVIMHLKSCLKSVKKTCTIGAGEYPLQLFGMKVVPKQRILSIMLICLSYFFTQRETANHAISCVSECHQVSLSVTKCHVVSPSLTQLCLVLSALCNFVSPCGRSPLPVTIINHSQLNSNGRCTASSWPTVSPSMMSFSSSSCSSNPKVRADHLNQREEQIFGEPQCTESAIWRRLPPSGRSHPLLGVSFAEAFSNKNRVELNLFTG